ncbi:hypothetical protein [Stieleria tagensis]|uniref:hypothetical protein n=1 Tax=Stieleria tagensis TaxID=2956795 RepID=UPI00209B52DA|nr:hypothetical protein [Stieleria tagensis]
MSFLAVLLVGDRPVTQGSSGETGKATDIAASNVLFLLHFDGSLAAIASLFFA